MRWRPVHQTHTCGFGYRWDWIAQPIDEGFYFTCGQQHAKSTQGRSTHIWRWVVQVHLHFSRLTLVRNFSESRNGERNACYSHEPVTHQATKPLLRLVGVNQIDCAPSCTSTHDSVEIIGREFQEGFGVLIAKLPRPLIRGATNIPVWTECSSAKGPGPVSPLEHCLNGFEQRGVIISSSPRQACNEWKKPSERFRSLT